MSKTYPSIQKLISTRLLDPSERPPIPVIKPHLKQFRILYVTYKLVGLFLGNFFLGMAGDRTLKIREDRSIKCLQQLGMLWIRIFQTFTLRISVLSTDFAQRLLNLKDTGSFFEMDLVKNIIEQDLDCPLEKVFDRFEKTPFSATTVSQLHRARLAKEQVWTAVKVQQPHARKIFDLDLKLFKFIVWGLRLFSIKNNLKWDDLLHELNEIKTRELNYYYEAAALSTMDKNLRGKPVYVPKVFRKYCSQRILVMEFIQGALLSDVMAMKRNDPDRLKFWLKKNNIDLSKVAKNLFHSTLCQVFEDNFFHGDMNASTIILMQNSKIALIECRSAGSLEVESLKKQKIFLKSLAEKEYVIAAEVYFLLASRLPRINLDTVKERLIRVWRIWETRVHIKALPYHQKSFSYMTGQINMIVDDSQFAPVWSFSRFTCAWVHLDTAIGILAPEINYIDQLKKYFYSAEQRESIAKFTRLPFRIASTLSVLHNGPKRTEEYAMFKEALMRRQAQVVQGSASKLNGVVAGVFGMISFGLLMTTLFVALVFSLRRLGIAPESLIGSQLSQLAVLIPQMNIGIWILLFMVLSLFFWFFHKQKKQFSTIEPGQNKYSNSIET